MVARKPLVLVSGLPRELPAGDNVPLESVAAPATLIASEALAAGAIVEPHLVSGTWRVRNADASIGRRGSGFVLSAAASGAAATVYFSGQNTSATSRTVGAQQYLGLAGAMTETAPSAAGYTVQGVGFAVSASSVTFVRGTAVDLAWPDGILDQMAVGATAAWSFQDRLRAAYQGPLFQVRRASDSAVLDIYPLPLGPVDQNAVIAFCGASTGYVSKLYDQSGNGWDIAQTTAASQPQIYSGSAILKEGSNVAAVFGAGCMLTRADSCGLSGNPGLAFAFLWNPSKAPASGYYMALTLGSSAMYVGSGDRTTGLSFGSGTLNNFTTTGVNGLHYALAEHTAGGGWSAVDASMRKNGATLSLASQGGSGTMSLSNNGTRLGNFTAYDAPAGAISTALLMPPISTAARATLESWLEARRVA